MVLNKSNMLSFAPAPRNRLYTNLNSYFQYLGYLFAGQFKQDCQAIEQFEKALCDRFNAQYAICVYQCRVGIYLAVKSLIQPGQEVILSPYTLTDVVNMVIFAGGQPVFADVDQQTCNISAAEVERLISPKTGAVLITHLHGLAAEAHQIKAICDRGKIPMIEDCAQAFGVKEQSQPVGTIGDAGIFSFEMHKNLPTWLGGAVVTSRRDVAEEVQAALEEFSYPPLPGITQKVKKGLLHDIATLPVLFQLLTYPLVRFGYLNEIESVNRMARRKPQLSEAAKELPDVYKSRYTSFQARLGLLQLERIDPDIQIRIEYAQHYYKGLKDLDSLILPPMHSDGSNTYLWFPIQYEKRDQLLKFMFQKGRDIAPGHFVNSAREYRHRGYFRGCPNATKVEQQLFYLPTYPGYSIREVKRNVQAIREYFYLYENASKRIKEKVLLKRKF